MSKAVVSHETNKQDAKTTSFLTVIENALTDPQQNPDILMKLLDVEERIMDKNSEMAFNVDFAGMQSELPVIKERGEIRHGQGRLISTYARYEDVISQIKPYMRKYGFAITFDLKFSETTCEITGILKHIKGHQIKSQIELPFDKGGAKSEVQAVGSTISYAKRYAIFAILNLTSSNSEDNDGTVISPTISAAQATDLEAIAIELKVKMPELFKYLSSKYQTTIESFEDIPVQKFEHARLTIEAKRK